ncbi:septum formation protein [Pullulanibacillus pueri]|uniref:dTTP/UTP pyrophosphatase n=1 Tax=Pullulanibacillus pueri TaxID=1437324 RepID=A0A8J2ZTT3_9BACL|nr:Maf family protein [Pullulanibacillus pueri]MBM7680748.1 septum formation protein [Pullulanibacillus pueri]GGH78183.1 Maf-like protein [Pullulanibacillus pueri]
MKPLILASSSPRRISLLESLGFPVKIAKFETDETFAYSLSVEEVVMELAQRKALNALHHVKGVEEGIIIGGDTVVVLDGEIMGKPRNEEEAFSMINALQGRTHDVYSGLVCIDYESQKQLVRWKRTKVVMKHIDNDTIWRYIKSGEPMDKAGAYAIQGIGATFIEGIEGDYFNVVGLSLSLLSDMLKAFGVEIL